MLIAQFARDQSQLQHQRRPLGRDPFNLCFDLLAAFVQLFDLAGQRGTPCVKKLPLPLQQKGCLWVFRRRFHQKRVEHCLAAPVPFGFMAATAGHQLEKLPLDNRQLRLECCGIKPYQNLILGHPHPLGHQDLVDDTAIGVLNDLPVLIDFDPAACNDRTREIDQRRPGPEPAQQQDQCRQPQPHWPPDGKAGCIMGHRTAPPEPHARPACTAS